MGTQRLERRQDWSQRRGMTTGMKEDRKKERTGGGTGPPTFGGRGRRSSVLAAAGHLLSLVRPLQSVSLVSSQSTPTRRLLHSDVLRPCRRPGSCPPSPEREDQEYPCLRRHGRWCKAEASARRRRHRQACSAGAWQRGGYVLSGAVITNTL